MPWNVIPARQSKRPAAKSSVRCVLLSILFAVFQTMLGVLLAIVVQDLVARVDALNGVEPDPFALRDFAGGVSLARMISPGEPRTVSDALAPLGSGLI